MSNTMDVFMNFFKPDKEKVSFGVNQVIRKTIALVEKNFGNQQVGIVFQEEGDPKIDGYPNEYSQVILNILMNARDELVAQHVDDALISIRACEEGGSTIVTIADNATGIDDEIIDRLFDPYFTTKERNKGTGIGLFMSKTIIEENMGGKLTVRNTGSGAEFRIVI
jgi:signal transduction histidine kinase